MKAAGGHALPPDSHQAKLGASMDDLADGGCASPTSPGGTTSSASVAASTCSTVTPSAVSTSVARPSGKPDHRELGDDEVHRPVRRERQRALLDDLGRPLAVCCMATMTRLAPATRSMAPPMPGHHLAGNHPVREASVLVDLQAAEHRQVEMPAADQAEGHRAVERGRARQGGDRPPARVREPGSAMPGSGTGPVPIRPFSDWKKTWMPWRHEVRHEGRDADAEIDQHAVPQLLRDAFGDEGLRIHGFTPFATR